MSGDNLAILDPETRVFVTLSAFVNRLAHKFGLHPDNLLETMNEGAAIATAMENAAAVGDPAAVEGLKELANDLRALVSAVDGERVAAIMRERELIIVNPRAH